MFQKNIFLHYNFCNIFKCRMSHLKQEVYCYISLFYIDRIACLFKPRLSLASMWRAPKRVCTFVLLVTLNFNQALSAAKTIQLILHNTLTFVPNFKQFRWFLWLLSCYHRQIRQQLYHQKFFESSEESHWPNDMDSLWL